MAAMAPEAAALCPWVSSALEVVLPRMRLGRWPPKSPLHESLTLTASATLLGMGPSGELATILVRYQQHPVRWPYPRDAGAAHGCLDTAWAAALMQVCGPRQDGHDGFLKLGSAFLA